MITVHTLKSKSAKDIRRQLGKLSKSGTILEKGELSQTDKGYKMIVIVET